MAIWIGTTVFLRKFFQSVRMLWIEKFARADKGHMKDAKYIMHLYSRKEEKKNMETVLIHANICKLGTFVEFWSLVLFICLISGRKTSSSYTYIQAGQKRQWDIAIFRSVPPRVQNSVFISCTTVIPARYLRGHKSESLFRMRDACPRGPTRAVVIPSTSLLENRRI